MSKSIKKQTLSKRHNFIHNVSARWENGKMKEIALLIED
jgi:hypothetical protein